MKTKHSHIELRDSITRLGHLIANEKTDEALTLAGTLKDEISQHAKEEEASDGWFQEAAKRAPRLNRKIKELRKQHETLINLVQKLCSVQESDSFDLHFSEFSKLFSKHDREEDRMIEEVFYQDDASQ